MPSSPFCIHCGLWYIALAAQPASAIDSTNNFAFAFALADSVKKLDLIFLHLRNTRAYDIDVSWRPRRCMKIRWRLAARYSSARLRLQIRKKLRSPPGNVNGESLKAEKVRWLTKSCLDTPICNWVRYNANEVSQTIQRLPRERKRARATKKRVNIYDFKKFLSICGANLNVYLYTVSL